MLSGAEDGRVLPLRRELLREELRVRGHLERQEDDRDVGVDLRDEDEKSVWSVARLLAHNRHLAAFSTLATESFSPVL